MVKTATDVPAKTLKAVTPGTQANQAQAPVDQQQTLFRMADDFASRMVAGLARLRIGTNAVDTAQLLQWKLDVTTETTFIASGPNVVANLLDLTMFVSVTRISIENYWQPQMFGDSANPVLNACRDVETNLWGVIGPMLTPDEQAELRRAIEGWYTRHPAPDSLLGLRAGNYSAQAASASQASAAKSDNLLSKLTLDPFSGLDPAVRELTQTRLFAERALYVTQKMPTLLRWQTELLTLNTVNLPAVREIVTNTSQIASSLERFSLTAEKLPGQVSAEREAIVEALTAQQASLTPLVSQVREAMAVGTQMSTSLNTTITTFDGLMKRFGVGEPKPANPAKTNSVPFRILDYAQTATQLEAASRQLTELLVTLDQTLGSTNLAKLSTQMAPVVQQAQAGGRQLVDNIFWDCVWLVMAIFACALAYRFLSSRIGAAGRSKQG